ncbi:hypothetical protein DQ04_03061070 [Trypanosoma grayi]|uniref:hypothetical protein n=1 Tax=Trypanosoma grayi TaxID=71804 RepID=UPI0004F45C51|nr:hypothetical protein DQ04_03061070 [Trypanosoma grayi]KEG11012.1 hypothetical protein DQ04_03061070 [Trypanosoma grayi]
MAYAQKAMRHPSIAEVARSEFLSDIGRRSVFRIWRYNAGTGCRPHYDPGLCTALLQASAPGLEVNLEAELPSLPGRPGNYRYDETGDESVVDALPGWKDPGPCAEGEDTLLLSSNLMRVLSNGALPAVLHRVRSDWAARSCETVRYSFVVELRPAQPRRWYNLVQQQRREG